MTRLLPRARLAFSVLVACVVLYGVVANWTPGIDVGLALCVVNLVVFILDIMVRRSRVRQ